MQILLQCLLCMGLILAVYAIILGDPIRRSADSQKRANSTKTALAMKAGALLESFPTATSTVTLTPTNTPMPIVFPMPRTREADSDAPNRGASTSIPPTNPLATSIPPTSIPPTDPPAVP